jgi:hypothetical protein
MNLKQEKNEFESHKLLDSIRFDLKAYETNFYDLQEEYKSELTKIKNENLTLAAEKKEISLININLKEDLLKCHLKFAEFKSHVFDEMNNSHKEIEEYKELADSYKSQLTALTNETKAKEEKTNEILEHYKNLQREKKKADAINSGYVQKFKEFQENLINERKEAKILLDLKLKDFNTALDEQKKQYETKYSTDVENLILSRRKSEITVQETKKELEKLRSEFDLLSSTSSLDKNEIRRLNEALKLSQEQQLTHTEKTKNLEEQISKLGNEINSLKKANTKQIESITVVKYDLNESTKKVSELTEENISLKFQLAENDLASDKLIKQNDVQIDNLKSNNQILATRINKQMNEIKRLHVQCNFLREKAFYAQKYLTKEQSNLKYCRQILHPLETKKIELTKKLKSKKSQLETTRSLFNKLNDEFNVTYAKLEESYELNSKLSSDLKESNEKFEKLNDEYSLLKNRYESLNVQKRKCADLFSPFLTNQIMSFLQDEER